MQLYFQKQMLTATMKIPQYCEKRTRDRVLFSKVAGFRLALSLKRTQARVFSLEVVTLLRIGRGWVHS